MDALFNLFHGLTKHVFAIVAAVVLAMLTYQVLYGGNRNATRFMCDAARTPMASYYYEYVYYPSVHETEGIAGDLGYSISATATDLSTHSGAEIDDADSVAKYSTGWF